jgi:Ca2+-binding RTX toxin-like protein
MAGDDAITGGAGGDTLRGGDGNDQLAGGDDADNVYGDGGNDSLDGGAGADNLYGGVGADVYLFGRGNGVDRIVDDGDGSSVDVIRLGPDIAAADLKLGRKNNDLVIQIVGTQDQLTVWSAFAAGTTGAKSRIERIEFADATVWTETEIRQRVLTDSATAGDDAVTGFDGDDVINGAEGNDRLDGEAGDDRLAGGAGADALFGDTGNDVLDGGAGADSLYGGAGNDVFLFGRDSGSDTLYGDDAAPGAIDAVQFADDIAPANVGVSHIGDNLYLSTSTSTLYLPSYFASNGANAVDEFRFKDGTVWRYADIKTMLLTATEGVDKLEGFATDDVINGLGGNDTIDGAAGNDTLSGGAGHDTLAGGNGDDTLYGGAGRDYLAGGAGNDTYRFGRADGFDSIQEARQGGTDTLQLADGITAADVSLYRTGNDLMVVFDASATQVRMAEYFTDADDRRIERIRFADGSEWDAAAVGAKVVAGSPNAMTGTAGNDTFIVDHAQDTITEGAGQGTDTVEASVSWTLGANLENLTLTGPLYINGSGNALNNVIRGNLADNLLQGYDGTDTLFGGAGDDALYGGTGADMLYGGTGDDVYWDFNRPEGDTVVEAAGEGIDTIMSYYGAVMPDNVENYVITSWYTTLPNVTGNALDNVITGNDDGNVLDGGAGADTLIGKYGDDFYVVDNANDKVVENSGDGNDTVRSYISYTLGANLENLELLGNGASDGIGNGLNNILNGSDFLTPWASVFSGYTDNAAANRLFGGKGNDTYYLGDGDSAVENAGEGIDTVYIRYAPTADFSLNEARFLNIENLSLRYLGGDWAIDGSDAANALTGGAGSNRISGGAGNDQLHGLGGDDWLDGGTGADILQGEVGNDVYVVDDAQDQVYEQANYNNYWGGLDTVRSSITYTLTANVENLVLTGTDAIDGTGNAMDNTLDGSQNSAANVLAGGAGNDTYIVGEADSIVETADGGIDTVFSGSSFVLDGHLEHLTLTGAANVYGTGNSAANEVTGNDGDNTLQGGAGDDTVSGGSGSDVYVFDAGDGQDRIDNYAVDAATTTDIIRLGSGISVDDVALERVGHDLVVTIGSGDRITVTNHFAMGNAMDQIVFADGTVWGAAEIRQRTAPVPTAGGDTLYGSSDAETIRGLAGADTIYGDAGDDQLFGDEGNDTLNGDSGNDLLDGGAGDDTLAGGAGDDVYVIDSTADIVLENADEGIDTVESALTYTLGENVENLALTGTTAVNGTGNSLDNVLRGNSAANVLKGGAGNDTYYVGTGDTVTENSGAGTDTVVSAINWTLGSNLENLTLNGSAAINGTGNALNNVISGNAANNTLSGAAGADQMSGGAGDDTYVVDNIGDKVVEQAGEGTDLVQSSVTYTIANHVENLTLTGTAAINGTGNALDNILTGNSAANTLTGGGGDDTLNGAGGADKMLGGAGNDKYVVDNASDAVTENANEGTDTVQSSITYTLGANVENLTLSGTTAINGTGNGLDNKLTGNSAVNTLSGGTGNDTLDGGAGADKLNGGAGNDSYVVDNTGDVVTENANEGIDSVQSSISYTLTVNAEALTLTGATSINGTGNASNNLIIGNAGTNTLGGAAGTDLLQGAGGADTISDTAGNGLLDGGAGNDTITGGTGRECIIGGSGNDTITTGTGADVLAFNRGDGQDVVNASTGKDNTLSLGGGIRYDDLSFEKSANDLILVTGSGEQVTFKDWYANANNHSVANLQMVIEGTADYDTGSGSTLHNKKVGRYDFDGLVTKFDQTRAADPGLTRWGLSSSLLNFYLGSSDTVAIGGDLAYQYAKNGNLSNVSMTPAQTLLVNADFGVTAQNLQAANVLQDLSPRLV